MRIVPQSVELIWSTPSPEEIIERSGRVCYKSEDKISPGSAQKFIKMIRNKGHRSVIEHAVAEFHVVCDRAIGNQIVRHRIGSYSQESTRFCSYFKDKFNKEITVIEPPDLGEQRESWVEAVKFAEATYMKMIAARVSPEIARSVLPLCLKTEIAITYNFREWLHFLNERLGPNAHPQIRELAGMIQSQLVVLAPTVFLIEER